MTAVLELLTAPSEAGRYLHWGVISVSVTNALIILLPFIPGLRDIPRWVPVHRLIWRDYYRDPPDGAEERSPWSFPPRGACGGACPGLALPVVGTGGT